MTCPNKHGNKASKFPMLHSKAAQARYVIGWLAQRTHDASMRRPADRHLKNVSVVLYALADFFHVCETADRYFTDAQATQLWRAGSLFLAVYSGLAAEAVKDKVHAWQIVPKHHYFCHLILESYAGRLNPAYHHCFADEDFVGQVARSTCKLHRNTLSRQVCQRYLNVLVW